MKHIEVVTGAKSGKVLMIFEGIGMNKVDITNTLPKNDIQNLLKQVKDLTPTYSGRYKQRNYNEYDIEDVTDESKAIKALQKKLGRMLLPR
jgi:signal recognition particle receptor subunit beta